MEVVIKNKPTYFENIGIGEIFEADGFYLKINDNHGFDVYNGEIFPFKENASVIPHHAILTID